MPFKMCAGEYKKTEVCLLIVYDLNASRMAFVNEKLAARKRITQEQEKKMLLQN